MPNLEDIRRGLVCPYCLQKTVYVDSKEVYGRSYGMIYLCRKDKAWVGVHKGTNKALGRLADGQLRMAKQETHKYFDILWKTKQLTRKEAYTWMARILGVDAGQAHIGWLNAEECKTVTYFAIQFLNDLRRLDLDLGAKPKTAYIPT